MNSRFSRIFRTSKAATWDPQIQQVYTTFSHEAKIGDWGMKHNLPTTVRTKNITVFQMDTKESFPSFISANNRVKIQQAWKENFLRSSSPQLPISAAGADTNGNGSEGIYNLTQMSDKQWRKFLDLARSRSKEWKEAISRGEYEPHEWFRFMNASNTKPNHKNTAISSPTYHNYIPTVPELRVKGRILNKVTGGYAVGIQGIVAFMPHHSKSLNNYINHRDVHDLYVVKAQFDSMGCPDVEVSMSPPMAYNYNASNFLDINRSRRFGNRQATASPDSSGSENVLYARLRGIMQNPNKNAKSSNPNTSYSNDEPQDSSSPLEKDPVSMVADILRNPRS